MSRRNNSIWCKSLVCKSSSVAFYQTRWCNKRILRKGYSVPTGFLMDWKLNWTSPCQMQYASETHLFSLSYLIFNPLQTLCVWLHARASACVCVHACVRACVCVCVCVCVWVGGRARGLKVTNCTNWTSPSL